MENKIEQLEKYIEIREQEIEELKADLKEANESITWWSNRFNAVERENNRLNNIIDELHSDLKTLWIVLWNMDTEMTGYQNEIFDKYYDEFHKE